MKKMRWSFAFESLMIVIIIIVQGLVIVTGYYAYRKLNTVISHVQVPVKTSDELVLLRGIIAGLSDTERNAKSFYLTRNGMYLSDYYESVVRLGEQIDRLDAIRWENKKQQAHADSIVLLIEAEMLIFNDLIYLDNNEHVTDELKTISERIENIQPDTAVTQRAATGTTEPAVKKKKSFFSRVFGRIKKEKEAEDSIAVAVPAVAGNNPVADIKKDVKKQVVRVERVQKEELQRLKKQELELTEKNIWTSDRILALLNNIEEIEKEKIGTRNDRAAASAEDSILLLGEFGALILALLLVTGIITVRYIYLNRQKKALLHREKELAQKQAEAKQNFLAHMSHEMRTPLNSIIGFLEQALETDLDEQQREQIGIAKKSSDHLLNVINNILDSSKLEFGKFRFQEIPFSPVEVIAEVVKSMEIQAKIKKLALESVIAGALPARITGDPLRLKQIILNILGNAIKYTPAGQVKLSVWTAEQKLHIEVTDTGCGIPEDKLDTIFGQYEQVNENESQTGTGLGLSITKNLVELQGGSIRIESKPQAGTTVSLFIPYCEAEETEEETWNGKNGRAYSGISLEGKRVLIADDEQFNRMLLMTILKKNGILFSEVKNGKEALEELERNNFDIILMDIRMPEMNGIAATEHIRNMKDLKKAGIPIIALTAGLASDKLERCRKAGMNEFLVKPCRESDLLDKISSLVSPG
ncbi:MAG: ATPase [Bacteroidetes bacterium]|nr:MAG: ATPase [Bacteroidota bacterium]